MGEGTDATVRVATAADARAVAELNVAGWRAGYAGLISQDILDRLSVDERKAMWDDLLAREEVMTFVAESGGRVAGYTAVVTGPPPEVKTLYVDPAQWRRGIGSALMRRGLDALAAAGCTDVIVWVFTRNEQARAFYAGFGFEPDGVTTYDPPTDLDMVRLRRSLPLRGGRVTP
jgi:GNAT superfamily N-acetyltransferase